MSDNSVLESVCAAACSPLGALPLVPARAMDPRGIEPRGIEPSGDAARPIEPSGMEPSGTEAALPDEDADSPTPEVGITDEGTVSTPATVGELTERAALMVRSAVTDKVKVQLPVSPTPSESVPDTV